MPGCNIEARTQATRKRREPAEARRNAARNHVKSAPPARGGMAGPISRNGILRTGFSGIFLLALLVKVPLYNNNNARITGSGRR